ncbi:MAG TPA: PsbP-related protein [Chitinophagaceae bacterium]|nr:PsbP-related protein [Chitinophagaceae bacterium]
MRLFMLHLGFIVGNTILIFPSTSNAQSVIKNRTDSFKVWANQNWKTLHHDNFSVQYPTSWELHENGPMGIIFMLMSPIESTKDKIRENINLIIQDLAENIINLNQFVAISEKQLKIIMPNSLLIESKRIRNGNGEHHKIVYTADQDAFHLKVEQYYWVMEKKVYMLTFTCEKAKFDAFKKIGERILNTFVISK